MPSLSSWNKKIRMNRLLNREALATIERRLIEIGWSTLKLLERADEVAVFGSFAMNGDLSRKDVDIFAVGDFKGRITSCVDLMVVSKSQLSSAEWLESEVAGHIAKYGKWLKGTPEWACQAATTKETVLSKARRIESHLKGLRKNWRYMGGKYRDKHLTAIRRHLQRLECLINGQFVPPSKLLDESWKSKKADGWITELNEESELNLTEDDIAFLSRELQSVSVV